MSKNSKTYKDFKEKKREIYSEERTILSYIRTGIAILGVGLVVFKLFTGIAWWLLGGTLLLLGLLIIIEEFIKLQKERKKERNFEQG